MFKFQYLKKLISISLIILFLGYGQLSAENVPHEIAGISLGSNVNNYPDLITSNYLKDVVVTDWHGFRKGVISYGMCLSKDIILKIDMKYADKSKSFFTKLLKRFRHKFGEPDIWNGDSFGVKFIWKWQFIDKENNRINLKLQHNSKDSNESIGNMLKLSYPDKINKERQCFMDMCEQSKENIDKQRRDELQKSDWSFLVPN